MLFLLEKTLRIALLYNCYHLHEFALAFVISSLRRISFDITQKQQKIHVVFVKKHCELNCCTIAITFLSSLWYMRLSNILFAYSEQKNLHLLSLEFALLLCHQCSEYMLRNLCYNYFSFQFYITSKRFK